MPTRPSISPLRYDARLERLPDRPLREVDSEELAELEAGVDGSHSLGDVRLSAQAGTRLDIHVLSTEDATDPAGIFGSGEKGPDERELRAAPLVRFASAYGWLCFSFEAALSGRASTSMGPLRLSAEAEKRIGLLDYRCHPADRSVARAVASDIARPRWVFDFDHLCRLGPHEALAFRVYGRLQTGVRARLSDLVSLDLQRLGRLVSTDEPLVFRVDSGLTVSAKISLVDEFLLAFSRPADPAQAEHLEVAVRKTSRRSVSAGMRLGLSVEIENFSDWAAAVDTWIEDLVGAEVAEVDALFAAFYGGTGIDEIRADPVRGELFDRLAKRLEIDEPLDAAVLEVDRLRARWQKLKDSVRAYVDRLVEQRLEATFTYDYRRIRESGTVLHAVLPEGDLEPFHGALLEARFDELLDHLRARPERVRHYLRRDRLEISHAWGFSLSLGSAWSLSTRSKKCVERVDRIDLEGRRNVVFVGERGYEDRTKGQARCWQVDFRAEMPEDLALADPDARELQLGLVVSFRKEEEKATAEELAELLDLGHLWGILDADDLDELFQELNAACRIKGRKRRGLVAELDLRLEHDELLEAAGVLFEEADKELAGALAAALPYVRTLDARTDVRRRRRLYEPAWSSWLELDDVERLNRTRADLGRNIRSVLRQLDGGKKAANFEAEAAERGLAWSFVGQVLGHTEADSDWRAFVGTLGRLVEIYDSQRTESISIDIFQGLFDDLQSFFHQELYIRALGDALHRALPFEAMERTLWIEIDDEDERRVYVGSPSTG